jgi:dihydroorotate dehydrogenase
LGRAIHVPSVAAVRAVRECIQTDALALEIAAVGGASTVGDFTDFFAAGADAVLCGSAPMYLPNLAIDIKRAHPEW